MKCEICVKQSLNKILFAWRKSLASVTCLLTSAERNAIWYRCLAEKIGDAAIFYCNPDEWSRWLRWPLDPGTKQAWPLTCQKRIVRSFITAFCVFVGGRYSSLLAFYFSFAAKVFITSETSRILFWANVFRFFFENFCDIHLYIFHSGAN